MDKSNPLPKITIPTNKKSFKCEICLKMSRCCCAISKDIKDPVRLPSKYNNPAFLRVITKAMSEAKAEKDVPNIICKTCLIKVKQIHDLRVMLANNKSDSDSLRYKEKIKALAKYFRDYSKEHRALRRHDQYDDNRSTTSFISVSSIQNARGTTPRTNKSLESSQELERGLVSSDFDMEDSENNTQSRTRTNVHSSQEAGTSGITTRPSPKKTTKRRQENISRNTWSEEESDEENRRQAYSPTSLAHTGPKIKRTKLVRRIYKPGEIPSTVGEQYLDQITGG